MRPQGAELWPGRESKSGDGPRTRLWFGVGVWVKVKVSVRDRASVGFMVRAAFRVRVQLSPGCSVGLIGARVSSRVKQRARAAVSLGWCQC